MANLKVNYNSTDDVIYHTDSSTHALITLAVKDAYKTYKNQSYANDEYINSLQNLIKQLENPSYKNFKANREVIK